MLEEEIQWEQYLEEEIMMQEKQPLVSVIMPVYNAEKYLSEAIESVISQSYSNWELLIVDDGSTDRSLEIINKYVKKDERIQLIQNQTSKHGPGSARNCGMDQIHGKYTYFMDADDWVEKDLLQDTVALAEETGADLVPFGFVIEENGNKIPKPLMPCGSFNYSDFARIANTIVRGTWAECHELIKSDLLQDVRHNQYRRGEDICFQMDLLCRVKKVCGIDKMYYHYRVVDDSLMHSKEWDPLFVNQSIIIWKKEHTFLKYCELEDDSQIVKNTAVERYTGSIYWLCQKKCPLSLTQKCKQAKLIGKHMDIRKYKKKYDCTCYSGMRRVVKIIVKWNLETVLIFLGTLYFKLFSKINIH